MGIYSLAVYVGEMLWLLPGALTPLLVHSSAADASDPRRDRTAPAAVRMGILVTLIVRHCPCTCWPAPLLALAGGGRTPLRARPCAPCCRASLPLRPGVVLAGDFIGRGKPHWNTQASLATVVINVVAASG